MKEVPPHIYRFGAFTVDTAVPALCKAGEPIRLTAKCLDLLCFLIENRGRLITKEEFMSGVWEGDDPDEATLTQHIYLLRKALGQNESESTFIETVPRVGYRFLAEATRVGDEDAAPVPEEMSHSLLRRLGTHAPAIGIVFLCAALVAAVVIYSGPDRNAKAELEMDTVTVLPFQDLRPGPDARLGVGIADLVIARLAASGSIGARPTVSILRLAGPPDGDPVKAGMELRSEMVVSGSVSREDGAIKAAFYVVRVRDGKRLYSEIVEVPEGELFKVQEAVAGSVAEKLVDFFADGR